MSYIIPAIQHGFRQTGKMLLVTYEISELTNPDIAKIALHSENFGHLCFLDDKRELENVELPKLPRLNRKTPSERLRAVLFLVWQQSPQGSSDEFYTNELERIIEHYKGKLE